MEWNRGLLQAYLDDEVDDQSRVNIEELIQIDVHANRELELLQELDAFVLSKLEELNDSQTEPDIDEAWNRFQSRKDTLPKQVFEGSLQNKDRMDSEPRDDSFAANLDLFLEDEDSSEKDRPFLGEYAYKPPFQSHLFRKGLLFQSFLFSVMLVWGFPLTLDFFGSSGQEQGIHYVPKGLSISMYHSCQSQEQGLSRCKTRSGDVLFSGTLVQFSYLFLEPSYVMIVSINHEGSIFSYLPSQEEQSFFVMRGQGTLPAGASLELDNTKGVERLFFLVSKSPFTFPNVKAVLSKAFRDVGSEVSLLRSLPGPWTSQTISFQKK